MTLITLLLLSATAGGRVATDDPPEEAKACVQRARELVAKGAFREALKELDRAVELAPRHAYPLVCRATLRFNTKDYDGTIRDASDALYLKREYARGLTDLDEALRLDPREADALNARAWAAATCPLSPFRDGAKALAYARRACEAVGWKNPYYLGTYAAACAEAGNFDEALKWQRRALEDEQYRKANPEQGREMLRCFEQHRPYREPQPSSK